MNKYQLTRRGFIKTVSTGAAAMGLAMFTSPLQAVTKHTDVFTSPVDPDSWFNQIQGKHRIVYDVIEPNGMMPFAWPRVFLMTNEATGTPAKDCSVVVVLRHEAIPFALGNELWDKYHLGDAFKFNDPATGKPSLRNPFWKPGQDDFKAPGIGPVQIGINQLQDSGVMFCACHMALTVSSAAAAQKMNMDPGVVLKEWVAGVLPGIQIVPSGVWAVGRAQEHGCAYCYAV
ncbi:MAG TPA: twin-arginine translocation signal domain-containing protein [Balneolales bacterium]|nr:twin-arginine translocation signal domain-containing protein [Balneolales bacterium]